MRKLLHSIKEIHSQPKGKYFIYLILVLGTSGIWLPIIIDILKNNDLKCGAISLNMATYFLIMLISNSVDKGLRVISVKMMSNNDFLNTIIIPFIAFILLLFAVLSAMHDHEIISLSISLGGLMFSLIYWWKANSDNKAFEPTSALGGEVK